MREQILKWYSPKEQLPAVEFFSVILFYDKDQIDEEPHIGEFVSAIDFDLEEDSFYCRYTCEKVYPQEEVLEWAYLL